MQKRQNQQMVLDQNSFKANKGSLSNSVGEESKYNVGG